MHHMVPHFGYHIMTDKKARKQQAAMILWEVKSWFIVLSPHYPHVRHHPCNASLASVWVLFISCVWLQTKAQSFKTNRWTESSVTLHETMIKDISKWIFAVVECIAQRLVNKEVLLTSLWDLGWGQGQAWLILAAAWGRKATVGGFVNHLWERIGLPNLLFSGSWIQSVHIYTNRC